MAKSVKRQSKTKVHKQITKPGIGGMDPLGKMPVHGHSNAFNLSASSHHAGTPHNAPIAKVAGSGKVRHKTAPKMNKATMADRPTAKLGGVKKSGKPKFVDKDEKAVKQGMGKHKGGPFHKNQGKHMGGKSKKK